MPDPSSDNLNEELNTAKHVQLENVGALTREQLTPNAASVPPTMWCGATSGGPSSLAFIVKAMVLTLGAGGLATIWEAVFADVGGSLLAILNALRIKRTEYINKP